MQTSYDIFDLAGFPIIVTDGKGIIKYKNSSAASFLPKFRKNANILKHANKSPGKISDMCEIEFTTGTQYTRAVVSSCDIEDTIIFLFLTRLQFEDSHEIAEHIQKKFNGNFLDFYISAYKEYLDSEKTIFDISESRFPKRFYQDLIYLMKLFQDDLPFIKKEIVDISYLTEFAVKRAGASFHALGMRIPAAEISDKAKNFCFCKINPYDFLFMLFRMIYVALRLSSDKCVYISLNYLENDYADICIRTNTFLPDRKNSGDIQDIIFRYMPELNFEFQLARKMPDANNEILFRTEESVLKINFRIKCSDNRASRFFRSDIFSLEEQYLKDHISKLIAKMKKYLKE